MLREKTSDYKLQLQLFEKIFCREEKDCEEVYQGGWYCLL